MIQENAYSKGLEDSGPQTPAWSLSQACAWGLKGPHTGRTAPTGTLGFSDRAEHAKSGLRDLWAVAGSSLQEEGQALSFSQRSLLKVTVTRGRFSQSQCLGTLCLKGEGGEESQEEKKIGLFQFSYLYFRLI